MRGNLVFILMAVVPVAFGDASVTVPWSEFSGLYKDHIEQRINEQRETPEESLHTLDQASYRLSVTDDGASGSVLIKGRVLRGDPVVIPLFANDVAVTEIRQSSGVHVLASGAGYALLPSTNQAFRLEVGIAIPLQFADGEHFFRLQVPYAVKNSLELQAPPHLRTKPNPKLRLAHGRYYFQPTSVLQIEFDDLVQTASDAELLIDVFTEFEVIGDSLTATSYFAPRRAISGPVEISLDPQAHIAASSVPSDWLVATDGNSITVTLPADWQQTLVFQYDMPASTEPLSIHLPAIAANVGRENEFTIRRGIDTQLRIDASMVDAGINSNRLPPRIAAQANIGDTYYRLHTGQPSLSLSIEPLATVPSPERVLDAVYFATRFTENGDQLSTLRVTIPASAGDRLSIDAIPNAEVWSVTVNDSERRLYTDGAGRWTIPLDPATPSTVAIAFLQQTTRLSLEGRLHLTLPATGLSARAVHVAINLTDRVDLVAFDSDLNPSSSESWPQSKNLHSKTYFFSRPFYRGQAIDASIYYKEPVNTKGTQS